MNDTVSYNPERVIVRFEVTLLIPVFEFEKEWMTRVAEENKVDISIAREGRIILIENVDTVYDAIKFIDKIGLSLDVGMIREIVEYYPEYQEDDFDDDDGEEFEIIFTPEE